MTKNSKFWVAVLTVGANFGRDFYGVDLGVDPETATALIGGIGAALVWLVPNA